MKHQTAAQRSTWVKKYHEGGTTITAISQEAGVGRSSLHRWLKRFDPKNPQKSLRHLSQPRPHRRTKATPKAFSALSDLTCWYPDWGKGRIHKELQAVIPQIVEANLSDSQGRYTDNIHFISINELIKANLSEATIGRMLSVIWQKCPVCGGEYGKHKEMEHKLPGETRRNLADVKSSVVTRTVTHNHNKKERRSPRGRLSLLLKDT